MYEFDIIEQLFKPLASSFSGSFGLSDDAALLSVPDGMELVITKDAICEGIHFLGDEDAALVAKKLLRVNLSDLAAKGAKPFVYFLTMMLPKNTSPEWIKDFAKGLQEDQAIFGITLAGGDTTATLGPKAFSVTAIGTVPQGQMLRRNAARPGDFIVVSGTLGDSALGLRLLSPPLQGEGEFLIDRYLLPQPRLQLGLQLHGIANACMDISDGLSQDLGHICKASNVAAIIEAGKVPLSQAAKLMPDAQELALTGGDDYELLFTVPPEKILDINLLEDQLQLPLTAIGRIVEGSEMQVLDEAGKTVKLAKKGYRHFINSY